jgi:hypothetical protein
MRKLAIGMAVLIILTAACSSPTGTTSKISVTSVTVTPASETELGVGAKITLSATVSPADATDKTVTWSSSDTAVATVNATTGEVTGKAAGTTTITATADGVSGTASITVVAAAAAPTGVTVSPSTLVLVVGNSSTLSASVMPANVSDRSVDWTSSDTDVAIVDSAGKVTAIGAGTATITATSKLTPPVSGSCSVMVSAPNSDTIVIRQKLDEGINYLKNNQYDQAAAAFEAAFIADTKGSGTYVESVVYSSLGKLSSILKEQSFRNLVEGRLGVVGYPDTLNEIVTGDWFVDYAEEINYWWYPGPTDQSNYWWRSDSPNGLGWYLVDWSGGPYTYHFQSSDRNWPATQGLVGTELWPNFDPPSWLPTGPGSLYNDNLVTMGDTVLESVALLDYLFFANLLDKNTNGLNTLLDEVLGSVFGSTFTSVDSRINTLDYADRATLDEDVLAAFGLDELFEGDDIYIGKAELKVLISGLRLVKGSLEWLRSYDWNTDINFLKGGFISEEDFVTKLNNTPVANLPLQNNFLKARSGVPGMTQAKADYTAAITDLIAVWESIDQLSTIPPAVQDVLDDYKWVKDGLGKLKTAINSGAVFYVPKQEPGGSTWPNVSSADAAFGVDFDKFFTPGYLAINKLIENESNAPVFYKAANSYTKITAPTQAAADTEFEDIFDNGYGVAIKFNYAALKEVFLKTFDSPDGYQYNDIGPKAGAAFYYRYHGWTIDLE